MFNMEGKLYKIGGFLGDIIAISILWIVFSIPIITIGATTTALYYVCTKKASRKDSYFMQDFINSFKQNFKKSTIVFLILLAFGFIIIFNMQIGGTMNLSGIVFIAQLFVLIQIIFISIYVFPLLSRFELSIIGSLKAASIMANKHMFTTLTNLGFFLAISLISIYLPMVTIFIMGLYIYVSSIFFVKIFRKYYPDFDKTDDEIKPLKF